MSRTVMAGEKFNKMGLFFEWDPKYFPDHESVNEALRGLIAIIKKQKRDNRSKGKDQL